jgi:hypothetical protein
VPIPKLVRRRWTHDDLFLPDQMRPWYVTSRERRLFFALTVVLSLNLLVICGVATFFALAFYK